MTSPLRPRINRDYAHYYDGIAEGRIPIQRCQDCGTLRYPPAPMCPHCHSVRWHAEDRSLTGMIHSYTVHHFPPLQGYTVPHAVAVADMDDGFRLVAAIRGTEPNDIAVGQRVKVAFAEAAPDLPLFHFVLDQDAP